MQHLWRSKTAIAKHGAYRADGATKLGAVGNRVPTPVRDGPRNGYPHERG